MLFQDDASEIILIIVTMFNWNKLSEWTNKAGNISNKMKDFAKDLITVDGPEDDDNPFMREFMRGSPTREAEFTDLNELQEFRVPEVQQSTTAQQQEQPSPSQFAPIYQPSETLYPSIEGALHEFLGDEQKLYAEVKALIEAEVTLINQQLAQVQVSMLKELDSQIEIKAMESSHKLTGILDDNIGLQQKYESLFNLFLQHHSKIFALFQQPFEQLDWKEAKLAKLLHREEQFLTKEKLSLTKLQESLTRVQEAGQQVSKREQQLQNENVQLQKRLVEGQEKVTAATNQCKELEKRIKELERFSAEWTTVKREFADEIKARSNEIDTLKQKLKQKDQEVAAAKDQTQQAIQDLTKVKQLNLEIEDRDEEIERLSQLLEEWQSENQQLQTGIQNIQLLHEQDDAKHQLVQQKYEGELRKARAELDQYSSIVSQHQELMVVYDAIKKTSNEQQKQIISLEYKLVKSEQRVNEQELQIHALQKKVKNDHLYSSQMVDRRVVGKFLLNYFDTSTEYQVKLQILETLASILQFTEEEKEKAGFLKVLQQKDATTPKAEQQQQHAQGQQQHSLKDKLIGFLMDDDE